MESTNIKFKNSVLGCQNCKQDFTIESEDFIFYKKLNVPPPTWCPRCRFLRRMAFANERSLYWRSCNSCGISMFAMYHPSEPINAWCDECYDSDKRNGLDYGREYDFSRPFFEQWRELRNSVPRKQIERSGSDGAGCDYSNYCYWGKNVYLSFNTLNGENIKYSKNSHKGSKNCMDCLNTKTNEGCYEAVQSSYNYDSSFLVKSEQCISSSFLFDCVNCINCCMSSNLRNKSYVFNNLQLSKEEYWAKIKSFELSSNSGQAKAKILFDQVVKDAVQKYAQIKNSINCTGDYVENAKDCFDCYGLVGAEDVKNSYLSLSASKNSRDLTLTGRADECCETLHGGKQMYRAVFAFHCGSSRNIFYCDNCKNCLHCFGCAGLKNKKYCIFNKQYNEKEYFELVEKIKQHMIDMPFLDKIGRKYSFGECFPAEFSPFFYNESLVYEENQLTKEEAIAQGYRWLDKDKKIYDTTLESKNIPDDINDVGKKICEEIIECPNKGEVATMCTYGFKILPDELVFYKKMNLPVPRYCPNCRYYQRLKWTNPFKFYKRECMCESENHGHSDKCENQFETMHAPDRKELIYCKDCYNKEVY